MFTRESIGAQNSTMRAQFYNNYRRALWAERLSFTLDRKLNRECPLRDLLLRVAIDCSSPEVASPRSISLATKGILDRQRPELLAVLKIFTEQKPTAGILGGRHDQRVVDG
jgi:hypothetical protein